MTNTPRLGILGGMGPQATNDLYQRILDLTEAHCDQEHIPTLIWSDAGMPDRTGAILTGETGAVFDRLIQGARLLEAGGCTVIIVPCNTAHFFLPRVQEAVSIPILNMVEESARVLSAAGKKRAGLLCTDGTLKTRLYQDVCARFGLSCVQPDQKAQKGIMSLIYDEIKAGKQGEMGKFRPAAHSLWEQGCDCAILACTELSVFHRQAGLSEFYLDAMDVLARAAVRACGKIPKESKE